MTSRWDPLTPTLTSKCLGSSGILTFKRECSSFSWDGPFMWWRATHGQQLRWVRFSYLDFESRPASKDTPAPALLFLPPLPPSSMTVTDTTQSRLDLLYLDSVRGVSLSENLFSKGRKNCLPCVGSWQLFRGTPLFNCKWLWSIWACKEEEFLPFTFYRSP